MNTNKWGFAHKAAGMGAVALAVSLVAPTPAYAAGADILIPKPAEFIPALIAFLIIWAILAKMAKNGALTDRMRQDVAQNTHRGSLLNWVRSFR